MNDPAFLFYSSDFITGVQDLTYEERGQYITMLCIQHQKGVVSSKWLSINLPNASSDVLAKFEKDEDGNFFNPRLRAEAEKRKSYKPKKIAAATLGGLISKNKVSKAHAKQIRYEFNIDDYDDLDTEEIKQSVSKWFKQMLNLLEDVNENENKDIDNNMSEKKFDFKESLLKLGVEKQVASDWLKVRSKKKASNTETAFKMLEKEVEKSNKTANECILICVENSWKGFKAEWMQDKSVSKKEVELN